MRNVPTHLQVFHKSSGAAHGPNGNGVFALTSQAAVKPHAEMNPEEAVVRLLDEVGEDPRREGLRDTPRRFVKAFRELTQGYHQDPAEILGRVFEVGYDEMIVVRDIEFWSLCEHHLLPFRGKATVGYVPNGKVVGLSKLSRLVQAFAQRLQMQERLTGEIAAAIEEHLKPRGTAVLIRAEHSCMAMRGIKTQATMVTTKFLGALRDPQGREEFLDLVKASE